MADTQKDTDVVPKGRRVASAHAVGAHTKAQQGGEVKPYELSSYEAMKLRVHNLKKEQQKALGSQKAAHAAETATLMEQRLTYETKITQLENQISTLSQQVKQANDRSAKLRSLSEKEKKSLQAQLYQANKMLEGIDGDHEKEVKKLTASHEAQLAALRREFNDAQKAKDQEQAQLLSQQEAATLDVEQWCQGEIEAVRHVLGKQAKDAHAQATHWQQQHAEEAQKRQEAEQAVCRAEEHLQEVMKENEFMAAELDARQQRIDGLHRDLDQQSTAARQQQEEASRRLTAKHESEIGSLKKHHRQQLDTIDGRLHDVLGRKDSAIAGLRQELGDVYTKLQKFEALLFEAGLG